MKTTRLSTKGQVVLSKEICLAHSWGPGTEFLIEEAANGVLLHPVARFPVSDLDEVAGCLPAAKGPAKAVSKMNKAFEREVLRRHDRGRY